VPDRPKAPLTALALLLCVAGCDRTAAGIERYRAGLYPEALAAFRDAEQRAGDGASPELLYDHALAAVRAGEPAEVDAAADAAAAHGGPEFAALREFLRGNAAYARAETAEFQADLPMAPPDSLDRAIAHATTARDAWTRAAVARGDWPAAQRNVRRAEILIDHLKEKKAAGGKGDRVAGGRPKPKIVAGEKPPENPDAPPLPEPPRPQRDAPSATKTAADAPVVPLTRAEVLRLLDRLDAKEREKLDLRRARRAEQPADVEKDW
jgi:hypothetical protein